MSVATRSGNAHWVGLCSTIERKCFAKHEAMDIATEAKRRDVTLLCASTAAEPTVCVGYLLTQRSSFALHVTKLVVTPAMRRQGIGRALLTAAVESGKAGRAQLLTLHVDESNEAAKQLYLSVGFGVTGRREDYYKAGRSALVMELALSD